MIYRNNSLSSSTLLQETVIQRIFNINKIAKKLKAEHLLKSHQEKLYDTLNKHHPPYISHYIKHNKLIKEQSADSQYPCLFPHIHYNNINDNVLISNTLPPVMYHQYSFSPQLNNRRNEQLTSYSSPCSADNNNVIISSELMPIAKEKTRNVSIGSYGFGNQEKKKDLNTEQLFKELNIQREVKIKKRTPKMSSLGIILTMNQKYCGASSHNNDITKTDNNKNKENNAFPITIDEGEQESESELITELEKYDEGKKEGADMFMTMPPSIMPKIKHRSHSKHSPSKKKNTKKTFSIKENNANIINSNSKVAINVITSSTEEYLPCTKILINKNSSGKIIHSLKRDSSYNRIHKLDQLISNLLDRNR